MSKLKSIELEIIDNNNNDHYNELKELADLMILTDR